MTLVGDERELPYERPPMSKEYLRREKTLEQAYVKPAEQYAEQDISLMSGTRVVQIRPAEKSVILSDGRSLAYDRPVADLIPERGAFAGTVITPAMTAKSMDHWDKVFADLFRKTRDLERLNRELERRVAERTAELETSTATLRDREEAENSASVRSC